MKKTILATLLLALSASVMTAQAAVNPSFADQLMMQKTQLHPQEFNFISDRYKQVQAHKVENKGFAFTAPVILQSTTPNNNKFYPVVGMSFSLMSEAVKPSFKAQLDSQKVMVRDFKFYPVISMSYTTSAGIVKPTFKTQLDSQKQQLRPQLFVAISDAYNQVTSH